MSPRSNLLSLLGEFARYSKDVAIIQRRGYRSEKWTYAKIAEYAALCALELKSRGIHTGQRVLLWGPNSAEWLIAFWGCILRGAIAVPMDASATPEFLSVFCAMPMWPLHLHPVQPPLIALASPPSQWRIYPTCSPPHFSGKPFRN